MSDFFALMEAKDVNDVKSFANYCHQMMGIPYPTLNDMKISKKKAKDFFQQYPQANYETLCKLVTWAKGKKKRYARLYMLIDAYRFAWQDGHLPELDEEARDGMLKDKIMMALKVETDPVWVYRFTYAETDRARRSLYDNWASTRRLEIIEGVIGGRDSTVSTTL